VINIENSRVITYGNNQSVTVYQDFSDSNTYYIVPEPVIAPSDSGLPQFGLVQYTSNDGSVAGTCSFQTELSVSADALAAVKGTLGSGITIGQFDWQSVQVVFTFATQAMANMQLTATPSMYGANRASFMVHLPDQATVNDFINAFSPSGSHAGTFMLEYDVTALTTLPPATVTVNFNANTAYDYEQTVQETRNVWGSVTSRTVTIHEHLAQSQAGTITVGPGNLDPKLHQKLMDWGNATLENDVNEAVGEAMRIIGDRNGDHFSMSSVASFTNTYIEGQIVPWIITPRAPIPAFTADQWGKVFSKVDNQNLVVSFTVENLERNHVQSIELTVQYPTRQTNNTFQFTPTSPGSWQFVAPGFVNGGQFSPNYTYQYTVNYVGGGAPYQSPQISSSETAIYLDANDLNILQVTFTAANVFNANKQGNANQVEYVLIDFFFVNQADGNPLSPQQGKLDPNNLSWTVNSRTRLPYQNPFQYRLTYVLTSGQQVLIQWQTSSISSVMAGGKAKAPVITLNTPFQQRTVSMFPLNPSGGATYDLVQLDVTYTDSVNKINEQNSWQWQPGTPPTPWTFLAPANQNSQVIQFSGEYIIGGTQTDIQTADTSRLCLVVSTTQQTFSVQIDPSQIEWDAGPLTQVVLNIYTKTATGDKTNIGVIPPFHKDNKDMALYTFQFATGTTPTCYYSIDYWVLNQAQPNSISEQTLAGKAILVIPGHA
jgi:hypothetical protein